MFFPEKKIILVHIPKTGGTSLESEINKNFYKTTDYNYLHYNHTIRGKFNNLKSNTPQGHRHSFISEYFEFLDINEYYSFSIIREPLSQVLSLYRQLKYTDTLKNVKITSLEDFIFGNSPRDLRFYNYYSNQYKFLTINDEVKVDKIFLFEEYWKAQDFIEEKFNIKIDRKITCMKTVNNGEILSHDMKKEIEKILPETFELYRKFIKK
jgi:hypothetical protein